MRSRTLGLGTLLTAVLTVLLLGGAANAQYPPCRRGATVSQSTAPPGAVITFAAGGFDAFASVDIFFDTTFLRTTVADARGNFSTVVTIPARAGIGGHTLHGRGARGPQPCPTQNPPGSNGGAPVALRNFSRMPSSLVLARPAVRVVAQATKPVLDVSARITVVSPATTRGRSGDGLVRTGAALAQPLVATGAGLLVLGLVAVVASRRRRLRNETAPAA
ncbi:MAG: hypothetical protein ABR520_10255 [Mycobacteriales bacterium]|nr:hypothetical protein [Frankia sp.]MCA1833600.1 hypothetical protein [Actinomycetota bacterium]